MYMESCIYIYISYIYISYIYIFNIQCIYIYTFTSPMEIHGYVVCLDGPLPLLLLHFFVKVILSRRCSMCYTEIDGLLSMSMVMMNNSE